MKLRTQCPLCISKNYKVLEKVSYSDENFISLMENEYKLGNLLIEKKYFYELRLCVFCGSRYQGLVLEGKEINDLYSFNIKPKKSFIKQITNYNKNLLVRRRTALFIKKLFKNNFQYSQKVLEIGAGWGFFAFIGSELNMNFTTIEISDERKSIHKLLDLEIIDNIEDALKSGNKFDVIYSNQVLEHIVELKNFLRSCNSLLNKGGYFIAEVPSYNYFVHYFLKKRTFYNEMKTKALEHLQLISDKGAIELINSIGDFEYVPIFPIRKFGDRIKRIIQLLTPLHLRGTGFIVARKIK